MELTLPVSRKEKGCQQNARHPPHNPPPPTTTHTHTHTHTQTQTLPNIHLKIQTTIMKTTKPITIKQNQAVFYSEKYQGEVMKSLNSSFYVARLKGFNIPQCVKHLFTEN